MIKVSSVYKENDQYKFTAQSEEKTKGYQSESKKKVNMARARLVKAIKDKGDKVYFICH